MKDLRKAAEMALEVLNHSLGHSNEAQQKIDKTKQELRQALAQPEQEPVECMCGICKLGNREWVGLTEKEICDIYQKYGEIGDFDYEKAIEAKLKEKNTC